MISKNGKSLGEIIKEALKERGIKASAVARKMNISRQTINQIDRRKKFDIAFLQSLKDASGLDFTHYAYEDVIGNMPEESKQRYLTKSTRVTISISVSSNTKNLGNLPELITQIEEISKKLGFELV